MHRVYSSNIPSAGEMLALEAREAEHLFKVFRARPGDKVEILDGVGGVASAEVESGRLLKILSKEQVPEPAEKIHLCCALPRKQKLDQLLKQAAELGAWSIRPVKCIHSVAEGGPRERWDVLLREACKQSGNPFLPQVMEEVKLPELLENLKKDNVHIYYGSVKVLPYSGSENGDKAVVIGPEGGFASEEEELLESCGAKPLNLGPYVLRLETAAVCALSALRLISLLFMMSLLLFVSGCPAEAERNPLMVKGRNLRESGDAAGAREYFRRAVVLHPDDPAPYLELAQVCDEELDSPLEAAFAYQMYLRLVPQDDPARKDVELLADSLHERALKKFAEGKMVPEAKYRELEQKYTAEKARVKKMSSLAVQQQQRINQLYTELQKMKNKGRKK